MPLTLLERKLQKLLFALNNGHNNAALQCANSIIIQLDNNESSEQGGDELCLILVLALCKIGVHPKHTITTTLINLQALLEQQSGLLEYFLISIKVALIQQLAMQEFLPAATKLNAELIKTIYAEHSSSIDARVETLGEIYAIKSLARLRHLLPQIPNLCTECVSCAIQAKLQSPAIRRLLPELEYGCNIYPGETYKKVTTAIAMLDKLRTQTSFLQIKKQASIARTKKSLVMLQLKLYIAVKMQNFITTDHNPNTFFSSLLYLRQSNRPDFWDWLEHYLTGDNFKVFIWQNLGKLPKPHSYATFSATKAANPTEDNLDFTAATALTTFAPLHHQSAASKNNDYPFISGKRASF